jgi:hypothetical protein
MLRVPAAFAVGLLVAACGSAQPSAPMATAGPTGQPSAPQPTAPTAAPASPAPATGSPVPAPGFAFDAESVLGYYRSIAYVCDGPVAGPLSGSTLQSCQLRDADGRVRVIGVITEPAGNLAAGFASVRGRRGEAFVDPETALEPLAGFLGAMLGEARGTELVPWLADHLGDAFGETASGDLAVLTYTQEAFGQTVLFVEVASAPYRSRAGEGAP